MRLLVIAALAILAGCTTTAAYNLNSTESAELWDASRDRQIPIELYFPPQQRNCTRVSPCPLAFLSQGYGLGHTDYSFISNALAGAGYMVVAIQHDLSSDPAISTTGDLFATRTPMWERGAQNIRFVRDTLSRTYTGYDWSNLVLVGHSNGGDLSALALHETPTLAATLITLDNRRYPLPRNPSINVLSIRGSDFAADAGVLPFPQEIGAGTCITTVPESRHNDMNDHGPADLQSKINVLILQFLKDGRCGA